jgi:hypothetical protein
MVNSDKGPTIGSKRQLIIQGHGGRTGMNGWTNRIPNRFLHVKSVAIQNIKKSFLLRATTSAFESDRTPKQKKPRLITQPGFFDACRLLLK